MAIMQGPNAPKTAVAIFSGGLDSTTMLYHMIANGWTIKSAVTFYYGQKHKKEIEYAMRTCSKLGIRHHIIDLDASGMTSAFNEGDTTRSLLSDSEDAIPEGHYSEQSMKATVVPNRNMIMISIAGGIAVAENAQCVAVGVHQGDHFIYPDCREPFIFAAAKALVLGNEGFGDMRGIIAPFLDGDKTRIAIEALRLNVPIHESWSCYKGDDIHCGRCGTCVERLEALHDACKWISLEHPDGETFSNPDQTEYADSTFWIEEVARVKAANENS